MSTQNSNVAVEEYKSLAFLGFPKYKVSRTGKVLSKAGRRVSGKWKELKQQTIKGGYKTVFLYKHATMRGPREFKVWTVHRLVLEAFTGSCPTNMECRHLDGNPANNAVENLCWGTHKTNMVDMRNHGNMVVAKLNDHKVREIRERYAAGGITMQQLANEYGVTLGTIHPVIHRKTWSHVK